MKLIRPSDHSELQKGITVRIAKMCTWGIFNFKLPIFTKKNSKHWTLDF